MPDRIAILIDGENVPPDHVPAILSAARALGDPILRRVYGKAACAARWIEMAGFRLVHVSGKRSAADMALAIDAVDLWRSGAFDAALLVTSDGDFGHLATWLREHGARVTGMGEAVAPEAFRAACTRFVPLAEARTEPAGTAARADVPRRDTEPTPTDHRIRVVIEKGPDGRRGMLIADLNATMRRVDPSFCIAEFQPGNWRGYLQSKPDLYALDPRGPEARVRFLWPGFNAAPEGSGSTTPPPTHEGRPPSPGERPHAIR